MRSARWVKWKLGRSQKVVGSEKGTLRKVRLGKIEIFSRIIEKMIQKMRKKNGFISKVWNEKRMYGSVWVVNGCHDD